MSPKHLCWHYYTFFFLVIAPLPILFSCNKDPRIKPDSSISTNAVMANLATTSNVRTGSILREEWDGLTGNDVSDIPLQTTPTSSSQLTALEGPVNNGSNYGDRMRGLYLRPHNRKLYVLDSRGRCRRIMAFT